MNISPRHQYELLSFLPRVVAGIIRRYGGTLQRACGSEARGNVGARAQLAGFSNVTAGDATPAFYAYTSPQQSYREKEHGRRLVSRPVPTTHEASLLPSRRPRHQHERERVTMRSAPNSLLAPPSSPPESTRSRPSYPSRQVPFSRHHSTMPQEVIALRCHHIARRRRSIFAR